MIAVYLLAAWGVLQVADLAFQSWGIPVEALRFVWIGTALGFPVAVVFSWIYEITPDGVVQRTSTESGASRDLSLRRVDYLILSALLVVAAGVFYGLFSEIRGVESPGAGKKQHAVANSIAVLPFADMSPESDQEYFGDGVAEELLNVLAKIDDFHVAGRTSSFSFKGKDADIQTIGEKLRVANVLEGSVRKADDQIRVTAQLINSEDGYHLWSETYDRHLDNIFQVQDEIAGAVVSKLKQTLLGDEDLAVIEKTPTKNVEAYNHYLRGKYHLRKRQKDDLEKAQKEFQLAIELDPEFALAYAKLGEAYIQQGAYRYQPYGEMQPLAQAALDKARSIDDQAASVFSAQAIIYYYNDRLGFSPDGELAQEQAREAVRLNPNDAESWAQLGVSYPFAQLRESRDALLESYARDPLHSPTVDFLASRYAFMGEIDRAKVLAQELININPDFYRGYAAMGNISYWEGRWDDVIRWYLEAYERNQQSPRTAAFLSESYRNLGNLEEARAWAELALENGPGSTYAAWCLATVWYELGDVEKTVAIFDESLEQNPELQAAWDNAAYGAMLAGDYDRAIDLYKKVMTPDEGAGSWRVTPNNYTSGAYYAFLLRKAGDDKKADAVLEAVLQLLDEYEAGGLHEFSSGTIPRAVVYAVRGDIELAIAIIRGAREDGWLGQNWLEYEPILGNLQEDAGYMTLIAEMRAEREVVRETLAAEGI